MNAIIAAAMLFSSSIQWKMVNVYDNCLTNVECQAECQAEYGANAPHPFWIAGGGVSAQELDEMRRKVDAMWTDYTNRMDRARIRRERIDAARNRPPSRPFRVKGVKK